MTCCDDLVQSFLTQEPSVDFPIEYGKRNNITITLENVDLSGYSLEFTIYKGIKRYFLFPEGLKFYFEVVRIPSLKTNIYIVLDEVDSTLLPVSFNSRTSLDYINSQVLVPSCDYDIDGTVNGVRITLVTGMIQNTPTGRRAA